MAHFKCWMTYIVSFEVIVEVGIVGKISSNSNEKNPMHSTKKKGPCSFTTQKEHSKGMCG